MNIVNLVKDLAKQDIRLWLEEGQLRFSAPEGAMTPDILNHLKLHKPHIIQFLSQSSSQSGPALNIEPVPRGSLQALSPAQQRLWFIQQLDKDSDAYHIHGALKLTGIIDSVKLQTAITAIAHRHEILRSHFTIDNGLPQVAILNEATIRLEQQSGNHAESEVFLRELLAKPFHLLEAPLFRVGLFSLSSHEHILSICLHHIIADGWSLGVLLKEVVSLYAGGAQAEQLLPPLTCQYVDYAAWQNSKAYTVQASKEKDFWIEQLTGTPILELPYDHHHVSDDNTDGDSVSLILNETITLKLQQFAKDNNSTLFMLLLTLYHSLLARLTGQQDFAIGTPVAGRLHSDLDNLIGCFVNTQAIRLETDSSTQFKGLLQQTKNMTTQGLDHQSLSFDDIVRHLNIERNIDIPPVFQTLFVLQNTPVETMDLAGLTVSPLETPKQSAQFALSLNAQELNNTLVLSFNYKPSRFKHSSVERFSEYFQCICESILHQPDVLIQNINLLSEKEQAQWLNAELGLNATEESYNTLRDNPTITNPSVLKLFEQQVKSTPHALAVSFENKRLSYQDLDEQSNQLAQLIIQSESFNITGNQPIIAVSMPRCTELSITLLAILKVGACYLPLDIELSEERVNFIFNDANPQLLINSHYSINFHSHSEAYIAACSSNSMLSWHSDAKTLETQLIGQSTAPLMAIKEPKLFNIVYTSGSTGTPKGVMVTRAGIHNRLNWMQSCYPLETHDKILQKTPYSFDVSVWELFWPLISGASLHFAKPDGHKDPFYIQQCIRDQNISHVHFVPSMLGEFLKQDGLNHLSSLKKVFTSGEALQLSQARKFSELLPQASLSNLYGPTEAAIDVSYYDCPTNFSHETHNSIPIGQPISNTQLYVLNDALKLQPTGIAGELYIGGVNVAAGYLNRPELTQSQFISNPYSQHSNDKILYKTGDRVRLLEDGQLEYLGRNDFQVKLRGLRIELGEIEAVLLQQQDINEVLVSVNHDVLVAYVIPSHSEIDETSIKQALTQLPQYMQPQHYVFIDTWPLTPNGKINRKALPAVDIQANRTTVFVAPSTETEKALASIWQQVLNVEKISIHDSFFDLGGHSLTATQAFTLTQEVYPVQLPLREIFDTPSIAAIAASIDQRLIEEAVFTTESTSDEDDEDMESFIL